MKQFQSQSTPADVLPNIAASPVGTKSGKASLRLPRPEDGPAVTTLIAACPPLDPNSAYCNLLQCSDFADTCVIAAYEGQLAGWISAYRPPARPNELFIWQVAVSARARGQGLGTQMLTALLERPGLADITTLTTTVTADNAASMAMFERFARQVGAPLERTMRFDAALHFAGAHSSEWQLRIGPFAARRDATHAAALPETVSS